MVEEFGLELMTAHYRASFVRKTDALVTLVHWKLMTSGLRCVGNGEHFGGAEEISPTELLPPDWNANGNKVYTLKYRHQRTNTAKFVLKVIRVDEEDSFGAVEVILVRVADEVSSAVTIQTADAFTDHDYTLTNKALIKEIEDKILKDVLPQESKSGQASSSSSSLLVDQPRRGYRGTEADPYHQPGGFSGIGRNDLDPLGSFGSGGMIADPLRDFRGGGSSGMGPRFDPPGFVNPFAPGNRGRGGRGGGAGGGRFGDDLPPPGFSDMFF